MKANSRQCRPTDRLPTISVTIGADKCWTAAAAGRRTNALRLKAGTAVLLSCIDANTQRRFKLFVETSFPAMWPLSCSCPGPMVGSCGRCRSSPRGPTCRWWW